jgi:hypothetical protein
MTMRPGQHDDELISASLTGDLGESEQAALDRHLAECARCRDTLAAFSEERRLISGMRHVAAPRDLGARVRAGIEASATPWWRRPGLLVGIGASLATVAAAVLAVVVLGDLVRQPVADTGSPQVSASVGSSIAASASGSPVQTAAPTPPASVPPIDPDPVGALVYTVDNAESQIEVVTQASRQQVPLEVHGTPTDATLSPDGDWLAFTILGEGRGLVDAFAYRISDGSLVSLATDGMPSPFSRFAWSGDGRVLAYTAIAEDGTADVWLFYPAGETTRQLTANGAAFAASFDGGDDANVQLWVSVASRAQPSSYRISVPLVLGEDFTPVEALAASAEETSSGSFLPMLNSVSGASWAAVWRGKMTSGETGWYFNQGGMLYIVPAPDGAADLDAEGKQVFSTLSIQQNGAAFSTARFEWAPDGDAFAVWAADWAGTEQGPGFPDQHRVYFGHVGDGSTELITAAQALDAADTEGAREVIDVALGGGQYLALTLRVDEFQGNEFAPVSRLVLVTRQTGTAPDDVRTYGSEGVWNGPALYPSKIDPTR